MLDDVPHADEDNHHTLPTTRTTVGDAGEERSITDSVRTFLNHHGLHHVIAFSGGAEALCLLQGQRGAILSDGTRWGVPPGALSLVRLIDRAPNGVRSQS